jgi:hypothetical protein
MEELFCALTAWLPIIKDAVLTGAAIVAGYVGLRGLGTWRRQLKGNTEYELAKSLLKAVYELREAIVSARFPFMIYLREPDMSDEKAPGTFGTGKEMVCNGSGIPEALGSGAKSES